MSESMSPSDPGRALDQPRAAYEPPTLTEYGTLEDLTQGAFGPMGDGDITGTQP